MKCKVKGHSHLIKDTGTGIIRNSNVDEFLKFTRSRDKAKQMNDKIQSLEEKVNLLMNVIMEKGNGESNK